MKLHNEVPNDDVPFLVQQADQHQKAVVGDTTEESTAQFQVNPEWFHTRSGHPRSRDD